MLDLNPIGGSPQEPSSIDVYRQNIRSEKLAQEPQHPSSEDIYRRNIRADVDKSNQLLVESFNVAVKSDPRRAREADRYARELGLPVGVAERKLEEVAAIVARRNFDGDRLAAFNPTLAQQLRDPVFARMAHDDIGNLSIYERASRSAAVGRLTVERGRVASRAWFSNDRADMRRLAEINEQIRVTSPGSGWVESVAEQVGLMAEVGSRAVITGAAAATAVGIAGQLGPQVAIPEELLTVPAAFGAGVTASFVTDFARINVGNSYAGLIERGVPRSTAQIASLAEGAVNTALDISGVKLLAAPFRAALTKGAAKVILEGAAKPTVGAAAVKAAIEYAKGAGGEIGTEALQEIVSIASETLATGEFEGVESSAKRVGEVALRTAQAMSLLAAPGPVLNFATTASRVREAQEQQKHLAARMEATKSGKLHADNPAQFQRVVDEQSQGETVYINGQTMADVLAQQDEEQAKASPDVIQKRLVERMSPDLRERLAEAITRKGDLQMSMGEFLTAFGNTPEGAALQEHVRVNDPEAMTAAEAAKVDIDAMAKDAEKQVAEQQKSAEQWTAEAQSVESDIYTQLLATGRVKAREAKVNATTWRKFVETQAERIGETPKQFADRYALSVKAGEVEGEALAQGGDADPDSYLGRHRPPRRGNGAPLHDLTGDGQVYPDDVYGPNAVRYYGHGDQGIDRKTIQLAQSMQGKPDAIVTVYRAIQRNVAKAEINAGDWVTINRDYAKQHGESALGGDYQIISKKVKASDIFTNGDSIHEWGYDPDQTLRQQGSGKVRGGFQWNDGRPLIVLTKDMNASTFSHESAHAFLTIFADMATQKVHPGIVDDFQKLLDWFGVKDVKEWNAKSLDEQRASHERFAREFEAMLWEGKEPAPRLKKLFASLMRFMRRVYESLQEIAGIERAPDDVRAVMERMLASEQEVKVAQAIRGAVPMFQTQEESGLDDAAWAKHQEQQKAADEAAIDDVQRSDLRTMRWLSNAKAGKLREIQQEASRLREGERIKVAKDVEQQPVYRAMRWLKTGEMVAADGTKTRTEGVHKMATAMVPEDQRDSLRGMTVADGLAPDDVASVFGFPSGETMLRELVAAKPLQEAIDERTDAVMLEKHTDLVDPRKRDLTIERALHNEARRRFVAGELSALMKAQQPLRVTMAAAKKAAEVAIGNKRVGEVNPRAFTMAARRLSQQAIDAQKAGDIPGAIEAKRRQLVQEHMALLAIDAQAEIKKAVVLHGRDGFGKSDKDVLKSRDIDYVLAGRALGAAFGLREPIADGQERQLVDKARAELRAKRPDIANRLDKMLALAAGGLDYKKVALSLFREVSDLSRQLWDGARDAKQLLADEKKRKVGEIVGALTGQIGSLPPPPSTKSLESGGYVPPWRFAVLRVWDLLASTKRMEHVAWWLDGNKIGPFAKFIVQPIMRAINGKAAEKARLVNRLHGAMEKVREAAGSRWLGRIHSKELDYTFENKATLLRAIATTGTDSGARKLLLGEKGKNGRTLGDLVTDPETGEQTLDTSRWDRFIASKWDDGTLNKADAEFLTYIWGEFRELLPRAQAVHKTSSGHEYGVLEERKIVTPFGTLDGGYVPVRADYDRAQPTGRYVDLDELGQNRENIAYSVSPSKSFSMERNENYLQPLQLDLGKLLAHLDEELNYIHLEMPTRDVAAILNGSMEVESADGTTSAVKMRSVLDSYDRFIMSNVVQPWLENVALQRTSRRGMSKAIDAGARFLRSVSSIARLGFNLTNSLLQATGISVGAAGVPGKFTRGALNLVRKGPIAAYRDMIAQSDAMRRKYDAETIKTQQTIERMTLGPVRAGIKKAQQVTAFWAFYLTRATQALADVVTWQAAKAHAEAGGASVEDAIQAADGAVRRTQGGNNAEDLARFEVATPAVQLLLQFQNYGNTILNNVMSSRTKASTITFAVLIPVIAEAMLRTAARPPEDDDGDGIIDDMAESFAANLGPTAARGVAGMVPLFGSLGLSLATSEGTRVQDAPAVSTLKDTVAGLFELVQSLGGDEITPADARKIAVIFAWMGLPVAAPTRLVQDLTGTAR